jgi:CheY-like chemotaxis protein
MAKLTIKGTEGSLAFAVATSRVLLVDDDQFMRHLISLHVGELGCEVLEAANGVDALAALGHQPADLVLMDVVMPGEDGFQVCKRIKADPELGQIPVVMLTALGRNVLERTLEAGAEDYLPKNSAEALLRLRVCLHLELHSRNPGTRPGPADWNGARILIVSRNATLRGQLEAQLRLLGASIELVEEMDARAQDPRLDLVLLDLDPVGGTPVQIFGPIQACLAVLATAEEFSGFLGEESPLDDVILKPLNAPETRRRLGWLMLLRRSRKENTHENNN